MTKTWTFVALGAVCGFLAMCWLVAWRDPKPLPTAWFELPGTPVAVDDVPVADWEQANRVLLRIAAQRSYELAVDGGPTSRSPESSLGEFKVAYRRRTGGTLSAGAAPEVVTVRAWRPITVDYSRAESTQLLRFERVRSAPVE